MEVDYDNLINTGELPKCFEGTKLETFINNLNEWD